MNDERAIYWLALGVVALTADEVSTLYAGGDGVNYSEVTWT